MHSRHMSILIRLFEIHKTHNYSNDVCHLNTYEIEILFVSIPLNQKNISLYQNTYMYMEKERWKIVVVRKYLKYLRNEMYKNLSTEWITILCYIFFKDHLMHYSSEILEIPNWRSSQCQDWIGRFSSRNPSCTVIRKHD